MGWFDRLKNRIQTLNRWISGVGAIFLIPLMLVTAADVVCRNLFNRPIMGVVESSGYLLAVFILLGLGYTEQVKAHVRVTIMTSRLSPRAQLILNIMTTLDESIYFFYSGVAGLGRRHRRTDSLRFAKNSPISVPASGCCRRFFCLSRTSD